MSDPLVSIIMRSFNEGWALRENLPALRIRWHQFGARLNGFRDGWAAYRAGQNDQSEQPPLRAECNQAG